MSVATDLYTTRTTTAWSLPKITTVNTQMGRPNCY